jgi:HEAT repeat protein
MNLEICPYCGYSQSMLKEEPFEKKLIRALNHPEPTTVVRAIKILGELKSKNALPNLFEIIKNSHDPFIVSEAVKSVMLIDSGKNSLKKLEDSIKIDLGILNPLTRS